MNKLEFENSHTSLNWGEDTSHIPYWVYQHPKIFRQEQEKIYQGPTWGYLCLEVEIPNAGDYISTFVGEMPVVVTRDQDGEIYAFENKPEIATDIA